MGDDVDEQEQDEPSFDEDNDSCSDGDDGRMLD